MLNIIIVFSIFIIFIYFFKLIRIYDNLIYTIIFRYSLLSTIHKTFRFLILFLFLFNNSFNHIKFLFILPLCRLFRFFLECSFLRRHIEDFKEIKYIEMLKIDRLKNNLTDHKVYVIFL
jgi:hypothetical protein